MPPSPVLITLRGWNEKQATSPRGRPIFVYPPSQRISLPIAQAASSISGRPRSCDRHDALQIAGHADLVHDEDGLGARRDGGLDQGRSTSKVSASMSTKIGVAPQ